MNFTLLLNLRRSVGGQIGSLALRGGGPVPCGDAVCREGMGDSLSTRAPGMGLGLVF